MATGGVSGGFGDLEENGRRAGGFEPGGLEVSVTKAGVDGRRLVRALALLGDGGWWTLADLVRETATSRRTLEALLRELDLERQGDRFRLASPSGLKFEEIEGVAGWDPADPVAHLLPRHQDVVAELTDLIARAPRGRHTLDHVAATADTVVRRALLLGARFRLTGARLLCVGDHDLTSLATALIHPGVEISVADIDERILAYIAAEADRLGVTVRTRWADLRLGLPASLRDHADLAITDPPYTPEGIGLFVARALSGLRDREQGRVLLAYGASERTPALALKVQNSLSTLNLAYEAIYPDFNRYHGAEAIGSAADLYILRPTTKTWPAVTARADKYGTAIYTQGPQSIEAAPVEIPHATIGRLGDRPPRLLVGDWPRAALPGVPRVKTATWLAKPHATDPDHVAIAVAPGVEGALARLLLATRAREVQAFLHEPPRDLTALRAALASVYELSVDGLHLSAQRLPTPGDAAGQVLRRVLDSAHTKLANSWREALIKVRGSLTKNQARALIAGHAPWSAEVSVLELPLHRLQELPTAVAATLTAPTPT
ncbi:bis-aminopropyl spermidine synthase family protein [Sinosporangium siamense]|uniref:Methyltransferase n=1 Tax=Sinosporangium siamense TaxID=1367973 RepID=A0A919V5X1_9ACTN|nr:bis-aminopropyl spermidine synthase family protein [Sinosporangium siamense]GII90377.1 methyltransferase [Sinosporangium siamense]